jgi:hypothetical protein
VRGLLGWGDNGPDADQPAHATTLTKQEDPVTGTNRSVVADAPAECGGAVLIPTLEWLGHLGVAVAQRIPRQQVGDVVRCLDGRLAQRHQTRGPPPPVPLVGVAVPLAAGREVIDLLTAAEVPRVIHIGLKAASFARDVGLDLGHGYAVEELRVFDSFPLIHPVECVAVLTR